MFLKTNHFKFIDGILHQLHEPHPNITDAESKWVAVESEDTKAPAGETKDPAGATKSGSGETKTEKAAT